MRHNHARRPSRHRHPQQPRKFQNPKTIVYDSNGPDVRIRGTAYQILEKYQALAKDAASSGDRVLAENYLQHAEHYQRIVNTWVEEFGTPNNADAVDGEQPSFGQRPPRHDGQPQQQESAEPEADLGLPASLLGGPAVTLTRPAAATSEEPADA